MKKELRDARSEIITYRKIISEDINDNISNQAVNDVPVLTTHDKGKMKFSKVILTGGFLSTHGWINPSGPVMRWVDKPKSIFLIVRFYFQFWKAIATKIE